MCVCVFSVCACVCEKCAMHLHPHASLKYLERPFFKRKAARFHRYNPVKAFSVCVCAFVALCVSDVANKSVFEEKHLF